VYGIQLACNLLTHTYSYADRLCTRTDLPALKKSFSLQPHGHSRSKDTCSTGGLAPLVELLIEESRGFHVATFSRYRRILLL
jgi:hypothetical protein